MVKWESISKNVVRDVSKLRGPVGGQKYSHFGGLSAGLCKREWGPWCIAAMQRLSALRPVVHMSRLFPKRKIFSLKIKSHLFPVDMLVGLLERKVLEKGTVTYCSTSVACRGRLGRSRLGWWSPARSGLGRLGLPIESWSCREGRGKAALVSPLQAQHMFFSCSLCGRPGSEILHALLPDFPEGHPLLSRGKLNPLTYLGLCAMGYDCAPHCRCWEASEHPCLYPFSAEKQEPPSLAACSQMKGRT